VRSNKGTANVIGRAALFGVVAGLRSQTPGALLALSWDQAPRRAGWPRWPVLRASWGRVALVASGAGELVGDKLPQTPSRLQPAPLGGRIAFGTLAGAALASGGSRNRLVLGGAVGALGAVAGSYGGYYARTSIGTRTGLPDQLVALSGDALAIGLGLVTLRGGE
jgi:uncharacterized membrane protein